MSSILLPLLTGGAGATVTATGLGALVSKVFKRIAKEVVGEALAGVAKEADVKAIATDVTDLKLKIASELGGNSGGIRQAVDGLASAVKDVQLDVAHLKGVTEGQAKAAA